MRRLTFFFTMADNETLPSAGIDVHLNELYKEDYALFSQGKHCPNKGG